MAKLDEWNHERSEDKQRAPLGDMRPVSHGADPFGPPAA